MLGHNIGAPAGVVQWMKIESRRTTVTAPPPPNISTNGWCSGTMMVGGLGLNDEVKQRSQLLG